MGATLVFFGMQNDDYFSHLGFRDVSGGVFSYFLRVSFVVQCWSRTGRAYKGFEHERSQVSYSYALCVCRYHPHNGEPTDTLLRLVSSLVALSHVPLLYRHFLLQRTWTSKSRRRFWVYLGSGPWCLARSSSSERVARYTQHATLIPVTLLVWSPYWIGLSLRTPWLTRLPYRPLISLQGITFFEGPSFVHQRWRHSFIIPAQCLRLQFLDHT